MGNPQSDQNDKQILILDLIREGIMTRELKTIKLSFAVLLAIVITMALWSPHALAVTPVKDHDEWVSGDVPFPFLSDCMKALHADWSGHLVHCDGLTTTYGVNCSYIPGCSNSSGGAWQRLYCGDGGACSDTCAEVWQSWCYEGGVYDPATYDFDNDGIKDNVDPFPEEASADADDDGVNDADDPFPNDPSCPLAGGWSIAHRYTHTSGCRIIEWEDLSHQCGNFLETDCGSGVVADITNPCPGYKQFWNECLVNTGSWKSIIYISISGLGSDWSQIVTTGHTETHGSFSNDGGGSNGPGASVPISGGTSGTTDVSSLADADNRKLAELLEGIQKGVGAVDSDLKALIGGTGPGSGSGTGGYWDNSKAASKAAAEEVVDDKMADPGDSGIPSDPNESSDAASYQDNSSVSDEVANAALETEQSNLSAWIDTWLSNSTIFAFFSGSGFEAVSQSCSFSCEVFGHEITFSMCDDYIVNTLDLMGYFLLGLAGIFGILIIFKR